MFQQTVLDNGLRVLTVPMPGTRSVSLGFFIGAGSRYERDEEAGLSHFAEHLHFKGTQRRPEGQFLSEAIEGVGGEMNADTDREMTVSWTKVARAHFPLALDLLTDMLRNSLYRQEHVDRERKVILEEINAILDSPQEQADLLIDEVLWPAQPLGREVAGTKDSVGAITREQIVAYVAAQYVPNNSVVAVAGDLMHAEVVDAVAGQLAGWKAARPRAWYPAVNGQKQPQTGLRPYRTEQAYLCLAYRGFSSRHPDRYALDLLNSILGGGTSSRLFVEIREKRGLAYDVHSYSRHYQDDGALTIYAGVAPKAIDTAVAALQHEVRRLKEGVLEPELKRVKEMTRGRMLLRSEDTLSLSRWVGAQAMLTGEVKTVDETVAKVDAITADDLQRVAETVLQPEKANLAVVGPYRSQARFARLVRG
jgi:predicted Zn-dependent peptidase